MKLGRAPVLHLVIGDTLVRAEARRGGVAFWAAEAAYASPDDLAEVIARLAAAPAQRCKPLHVTLERPPAQTRTLTDLPPVRERQLAALVANQAGRFFRRNGAPLVTDAVWVVNGKGRVTKAAAVEERLVVAVLAGAREAGLTLEGITPAGTSPELQLLPTAERAVRDRARRRNTMRLGAVALLTWLLAGGVFGFRLVNESRDIERELAAARQPLEALRDVRQEMRAADAMIGELAVARRSRGEALAALARMSAALPDSAILTSYVWRADGSGLASGAARRAADVLAAVDRSAAVASPRLEGAVVRENIAGGEWERFTLLFGARVP